MTAFDRTAAQDTLRRFEFRKLFIEQLGWDQLAVAPIDLQVDGQSCRLIPVAQKRGVQVFEGRSEDGVSMPAYQVRQKIERELTKRAREHLVVFADAARQAQVWQWVSRGKGQPTAYREERYDVTKSGEPLLHKLEAIRFDISEEESITLTEVIRRLRGGFDKDRIVKAFYDRFQKEQRAFLAFITGIRAEADRAWYSSLMLNRLMFIYFIQKKGFLDGDPDYLRNRLNQLRQQKGSGKFLSFYQRFLLKLFHEGLARPEGTRAHDLDALLGVVPYLNGGLFDVHALEEQNPDIDIPDDAFDQIFSFFDQYQWYLDDRPLGNDKEINPDVLGYIFEKYVNQKQMGAYYTKEDITEYIARNTLIPYIFEAAKKNCAIAFRPEGEVWRLAREDPDRYFFEAVKKGVDHELPTEIAAGINDDSARGEWNKLAPEQLALPTETWREVVARRQRYNEVKTKLVAGDVVSIDDFVSYNLDIRQFAQDVIEHCEGPELLRAFLSALQGVTILDPACGSGAFLFAALNILEPLYESCIQGARAFVADLDGSGEQHSPKKFEDLRKLLTQLEAHPNQKYFVLKSIIINNLYGVDIMEEAVEICKLRLFLKLVAQVDQSEDIEPLPDIDFNIRAGNTLVGFASMQAVREALTVEADGQHRMSSDEDLAAMARVEERAAFCDMAYRRFRHMQVDENMDSAEFSSAKRELRDRLESLQLELDGWLAATYGLPTGASQRVDLWRISHQPFHWLIDFYSIMRRGGFDVIIGNPPYIEVSQVSYIPRGLQSLDTGAVHAMFVERSLQLLARDGAISMIVPLSIVSTQRMKPIQMLVEAGRAAWYANYSWRPAKLFDTVNRALTIFVARQSMNRDTYSTCYQKWTSANREGLMEQVTFVKIKRDRDEHWIPKLGANLESGILEKVSSSKVRLGSYMVKSEHRIYYRSDGGLYWKVFTDFPPDFILNGKHGHSSRETWFAVSEGNLVYAVIALLSSNTYWWWYTVTSNCRHLNPYDLQTFPIPAEALRSERLIHLGHVYLEDIKANSTMLVRQQKQTGTTQTQSFKIQRSKSIIDAIDSELAHHYGFTNEELDFLINYDLKFRIGSDNEDSE